jgi:hypothetical protein
MIDVDALKRELSMSLEDDATIEITDILNFIDSAPTIEELTKCKDCVWWTKADASLQGRCSLFGIYPTGSWFCANGGGNKE